MPHDVGAIGNDYLPLIIFSSDLKETLRPRTFEVRHDREEMLVLNNDHFDIASVNMPNIFYLSPLFVIQLQENEYLILWIYDADFLEWKLFEISCYCIIVAKSVKVLNAENFCMVIEVG